MQNIKNQLSKRESLDLVQRAERIPSQTFSGFQKLGTAGGVLAFLIQDVNSPNSFFHIEVKSIPR